MLEKAIDRQGSSSLVHRKLCHAEVCRQIARLVKANDPQKWNEVPGLTGRELTTKIKVDLHKLTRDDFNISSQPTLGDADAKAKVRARESEASAEKN